MTDKYISVNEAASRLGVTRHAIYKWIREGRLEAKRFGTLRGIRISEESLGEFEQRATIRPYDEGKLVADYTAPHFIGLFAAV